MMSIATTAPPLEIAPSRLLLKPLISAAGCVALADFLFYGWKVGISLALFFLALGLVAVARNRTYARRRIQIATSPKRSPGSFEGGGPSVCRPSRLSHASGKLASLEFPGMAHQAIFG
jgi:hypothetical protein